jgi:nucleoid-associated protein YgaU
MAIVSGSRYEFSLVDYFRKTENGETTPIVFYEFDDLFNISFITHTYTKGETLQGLSQKYLRTPELWWAIAEYNPEVTDFINIPGNTVLRIPNV